MLVAQIQAVIDLLEASKPDAAKVDAHRVGTPGTRLRKTATQACKMLADVKKNVLESRANAE